MFSKKELFWFIFKKVIIYPFLLYIVCGIFFSNNLNYWYSTGLIFFFSGFIAYGLKILNLMKDNIFAIKKIENCIEIKYYHFFHERTLLIALDDFIVDIPTLNNNIDYYYFKNKEAVVIKQYKLLYWSDENRKMINNMLVKLMNKD